jgi:hypothetical protein
MYEVCQPWNSCLGTRLDWILIDGSYFADDLHYESTSVFIFILFFSSPKWLGHSTYLSHVVEGREC